MFHTTHSDLGPQVEPYLARQRPSALKSYRITLSRISETPNSAIRLREPQVDRILWLHLRVCFAVLILKVALGRNRIINKVKLTNLKSETQSGLGTLLFSLVADCQVATCAFLSMPQFIAIDGGRAAGGGLTAQKANCNQQQKTASTSFWPGPHYAVGP